MKEKEVQKVLKLSIIIPCYNEKKLLPILIHSIQKSPIVSKEIILIDDGSNDGTVDIIKNKVEKEVDKVIYHPQNMGKGSAIRSGLKYVTGDIVIVQDADLEYDPMEYPQMILPIIEGRADVVFGSRFLVKTSDRFNYYWNYIANRFLTLLSNMLTNLNLTDMETCYKAFKTEIIKGINLKENGFGIEPELTIKAAKKKYRICEVPITYKRRSYQEGKKISWIDGLRTIYVIFKYSIFIKNK